MNRLIGKTLMLERLRGGGKGTTEDEMLGWHHGLDRHEYVQTPGHSEGQGSLQFCSPVSSVQSLSHV